MNNDVRIYTKLRWQQLLNILTFAAVASYCCSTWANELQQSPAEQTPSAQTAATAPATLAAPYNNMQRIAIQSENVTIVGWWSPAKTTTNKAATVILLHGCGGLYNRGMNTLIERHGYMAQWLNERGINALLLDSFTGRGLREVCTVRMKERPIRPANRVNDVAATLGWLTQKPTVDSQRIGVLGWSHGGSTVMETVDRLPSSTTAPNSGLRTAIAYYPGCTIYTKQRWKPNIPLLVMTGEADDWTPAAPCVQLAAQSKERGNPFELHVMPGAYHDFDAPNVPIRVRKEVPNGVNPGQGVTVGTNPEQRARSFVLLEAHLTKQGMMAVQAKP